MPAPAASADAGCLHTLTVVGTHGFQPMEDAANEVARSEA